MKKFVLLILTLALTLSLCACGKTIMDGPGMENPTEPPTATKAPEPTKAPAPTAAPAQEPAEDEEPAPAEEPEEDEPFLLPGDRDYAGSRGPDDPYVLYGIWTGKMKMIELDSGYDRSETIEITARFDYNEDGRGYFKAWTEDEDDPFLFVFLKEDPDHYWWGGIRTDCAWPEIGDKDCWILEHIMNDDHDGSTYSVVVNYGEITTLVDHDYVDASGNRFELQFDLFKDLHATM